MDIVSTPAPNYRTIATPIASTLIEKKSRFLCLLTPVASENEVQTQLAAIKKEHWSANHHCYAFRLLDGTERASDDGEPSGTAGRPMLHVLAGQELFGVLAVVTRYFGGTLLGAGGLVRAYSGVVAQAVKDAQIVTYAAHEKYEFPLAYADYVRVQNNIYGEPTWRVDANFTELVTVTLIAPAADATRVREQVTAMTRSAAYITPVEVLWLPLRG